jgi:cysteine-rich repeat protein
LSIACTGRAQTRGAPDGTARVKIVVYTVARQVVRPSSRGTSMTSTQARTVRLTCLVLALAGARIAAAERLFVRAAGLRSSARGIARVETLGLDTAALSELRGRTQATLTEFPLGADGLVTLAVERFEPFTDGARAVVMENTGPRELALPDQLYYRGRVVGDASSLVVLVAAADTARGFVATGGTIYRFGRDGTGVHRAWALRDVDPSVHPGPGAFCANDQHVSTVTGHPGRVDTTPGAAAAPPVAGFSPTLLAQVAVETDQELLAKFADATEALAYLADLMAAVSAIYEADTDVRVRFHFIRLWSTSDPWTATGTGGMLDQLQSYWQANEGATVRDLAHFVSGKSVTGGIAYVDVLCDDDFGYGVSTVFGEFDMMDPDDTWDVFVVAHELGHNFGSEHTHCYDPPLDNCYNGAADDGCYDGPESLPPGGGTIMSYCHLLGGGMSNVNPTFGATVSAVLRGGAENGICIGLPCGDGILDSGEDCDDGNTVSGDCCSASCLAEPDGGSCDDGEVCTSGDQCASGACTGSPVVDGSPCDDGSRCTHDGCQAGACVGVAAPATGCRFPTQAFKSQILLKDKPTDKSDQVSWKWTRGEATTFAELGAPTTTDDYTLCVYGVGPTVLFRGDVPAGGTCGTASCWKTIAGKGYGYKDRLRTSNGMEKLSLSAGLEGSAKASARGKGVNLDVPTLGSLATPIRVQLRGPGICFEATYSTPLLNTTEQFKAKSDPPPP